MITVSDYKLGGHWPAYIVAMDGCEAAQAIFFDHDYAMVYARALQMLAFGVREEISDETTKGRAG